MKFVVKLTKYLQKESGTISRERYIFITICSLWFVQSINIYVKHLKKNTDIEKK